LWPKKAALGEEFLVFGDDNKSYRGHGDFRQINAQQRHGKRTYSDNTTPTRTAVTRPSNVRSRQPNSSMLFHTTARAISQEKLLRPSQKTQRRTRNAWKGTFTLHSIEGMGYT
jgi:hypothetical protein